MVQSLPNLRHIYINKEDFETFSPTEYHRLFEVRSSLRTVIHDLIKYFYDGTTKALKDITYPYNVPLRAGEPNHSWACEGIPHHYAHNNKCWE